ncbi:MAG: (2Fe-2S)-binding protein [Myxococcales bacterium]|nr:(2Fe-2S)-binding protein [Myxococcales bacterium]
MLVCHCKVVNDRTIRRCVDEGAHTRREVGRACGAGTCCGGCRTLVDEVIEDELQRRRVSRVPHRERRLGGRVALPIAS